MNKAIERKIPLGLGRGSACGCLCAYMMNITQVDSVKWDLDFSRFANLGRKSMADIDLDISRKRRREIIEITEGLFGKENVAPMCTFNSLSTKVAIKDIGKVLNEKGIYEITYQMRDEVAKMIPTIKTISDLGEEEEKEVLLRDVLFKNEKLKEYNDRFPLWFKYVVELEGSPKSLGRHASGTLITPKPICQYLPLCLDSDGNPMTQLEMHNSMDDLKLIKMDYLGLNSLDIIDDTLRVANKDWEYVNVDKLDLADKEVFMAIYKNGNTTNIFQMESAEAVRMCIEAQVDNVEDIIAINAFNRPGTKDGFPTYVENKRSPDSVNVVHDDLLQIFAKTHFVLLYQEQALQLFRHAGFPEDMVDNARRAIGHKEKETMRKLKIQFIDGDKLNGISGLLNKGWTREQAQEVWILMEKQADYSFNRSHSVAYGLTSYIMSYLKHYYPVEFMTACMNANMGNTSKLSILINECNRLGVKVKPPHINKSNREFTPIIENKEVLFGFLPIKDVGDNAVNSILELRPFENFDDFLKRTNNVLDKTTIIALCKAGAIPTKNKMNLLLRYSKSMLGESEYKDVKSLPTLLELQTKWDIDTTIYKNKEDRLKIYNIKKKQKYEVEQQVKINNKIQEFKDKYLQKEHMWEFETLSMFLTSNPFDQAYKEIDGFHRSENDTKCVCLCVLIDIKRKKDKNGNAFAYLDLYTPSGIIESICWSKQYSVHQDLLKKGNALAILGRKREDKLFIEKIKSYEQWKIDKNMD